MACRYRVQLVPKVSDICCYVLLEIGTYRRYIRCDATPDDLDGPGSHRRSHEKTDFLIKTFDPGILWDEFGIRSDIVVCFTQSWVLKVELTFSIPLNQPFTHGFPWADIHELLSPDLLHQLIKGVFKDHLVTWVCNYLFKTHGEAEALKIIEDIDHRCVFKLCFALHFKISFSCIVSQQYLRILVLDAFQMVETTISGLVMIPRL